MFTVDLPVFSEYLYCDGEEWTDGYKKTGRQGILGNFTCSKCGRVFGEDFLLDTDPDDIRYSNIELDCICKESFIAFEEFNSFEIEVLNKHKYSSMFNTSDECDQNDNKKDETIYTVYLNFSTDGDICGPSTKESGTIDSLRCPQCLSRFYASKKGAIRENKKGEKVIICDHCASTYLKSSNTSTDKSSSVDTKSTGISNSDNAKQTFVESFFFNK